MLTAFVPESESFSRQELSILILGLDVPDCGCRIKKIPVCVIARNPCPERLRSMRRGKKVVCKCPKAAPPCEHIRAAKCELSEDELIELLWEAYPERYGAEFPDAYRPPNPSRARMVTHGRERALTTRGVFEPYLEVMEERESLGQCIDNADDVFIEDGAGDGRLIHHDRNGSLMLGDLLRLNCEDGQEEDVEAA